MSINASTIWELRTTGDWRNGGGFYDRTPGTSVDYTQQTSPELEVTDAACASNTTLTSATGGFTAAMVGSIVCISSGTNAIVGWYEITARTDANTVTIDRTCATGGNMTAAVARVGGAWNVGGADADRTFFNTTNKNVSNSIHIKSGTYTFSVSSGSIVLTGKLFGYNSTRLDAPTLTNRPIFANTSSTAANYFSNSAADIQSMRFSTTDTTYCVVLAAGSGRVINCSFLNSFNSASAEGLRTQTACFLIGCRVESTYGYGWGVASVSPAYVDRCYFKGVRAFQLGATVTDIITNCVFKGSSYGIYNVSTYSLRNFNNNVVYGGTYGLYGANWAAGFYTFYNNIISGNTTGIYVSASHAAPVFTGYNCWYNNTNNGQGGWTLPATDITSDPLLNDPGNDDFTLQAASPCKTAGLGLALAGVTA
jgi:hypothetical protein